MISGRKTKDGRETSKQRGCRAKEGGALSNGKKQDA